MKQLIAIGVVLLSLLTMARHAEVFCSWGACGVEQVAGTGHANSCCHSHTCHAGEQHPASPCEDESNRPNGPCPCPENCWCHQPPQPLELPKLVGEPFELTLHDVHVICYDLVALGITDYDAYQTWLLPPDGCDESAVCRCAKLCRFLI